MSRLFLITLCVSLFHWKRGRVIWKAEEKLDRKWHCEIYWCHAHQGTASVSWPLRLHRHGGLYRTYLCSEGETEIQIWNSLMVQTYFSHEKDPWKIVDSIKLVKLVTCFSMFSIFSTLNILVSYFYLPALILSNDHCEGCFSVKVQSRRLQESWGHPLRIMWWISKVTAAQIFQIH